MSLTYDTWSEKVSSEKNLIAWVEPAERIRAWTVHSGSVYKYTVNFFVIDIKEDGASTTEVASIAAIDADKKWFFDTATKILYYRATGEVNPSTLFTVLTYRIGFSTFPYIGPIGTGLKEIEYYPLLISSPRFRHELDHADQIGIALSSSSTMRFIAETFFRTYYDTLTWENKKVTVYSFSPEIIFSEKRLYFSGLIEDKSFTTRDVQFKVKDVINNLKRTLPLEVFSEGDGFDIPDSLLGKAKRRIYGRVAGLKAICTNQTLDGFSVTGTFSATVGATTITAASSNIASVAVPGDELILGEYTFEIAEVTSATVITVTDEIEEPFSGLSGTINPAVQSARTGRNTDYLICDGHALKEASTTTTENIQFNRFRVSDASDFMAGDVISIGGVVRTIRRVSTDDVITLTQNLNSLPSLGAAVTRSPVQKVYANKKELLPVRDYTVTNTSGGCTLELDALVEFNVATKTIAPGAMSFTNGSNEVTVADVEITANFRARDWIKPQTASYPNWYEVTYVDEDNSKLIIATNFAESNYNNKGLVKKIDPIGDEADITLECFGKTEDGTASGVWIKTAAQVVEDVMSEADITNLNAASFTLAEETAPQIVSLKLPLQFDSKAPTVRQVVELMNESVFGSLHYNSDFEIEYNILTAERPTIEPDYVINDSDVKSWSIQSSSKNIISAAVGNYKHLDIDRLSGEPGNSIVEYESEIVQRLVGLDNTKDFDIYLFYEDDAKTIAERRVFMNEISQSVVTIKGKLDLNRFKINDKILLDFDTIYARFGSISTGDRRKVGIVSGVDKTQDTVSIKVDDLGNIYNRVAAITDNGAVEFSASGTEKIVNGYITDNDDLIDDSQDTYRINLIG